MGFAVRHHELLDDGVVHELEKLLGFLKQFLLKEHNEDGTHITDDPSVDTAAASNAYVTVGNTSRLSAERALTGTANQVSVTDNGANSTVQLGLPQSIGTVSSPEFTGLTLSGLTATRLVATSGAKALASVANLASWIAGTTNQVAVADDGDGTITLSTPQNIHTGASPTFAGLTSTGAVDIQSSLRCDSIVNDTGLAAGTYAPTRSSETNLDANVTLSTAVYMRVGSTVTVSGRFTANPTLTATATNFEMDLPVASNLGAVEDLSGVAFCGAVAGQGAEIIGVVANDTAQVQWVAGDVTEQTWSYTFQYRVI